MPDVEKLRKEAAERARNVKKEQGALPKAGKVDYTKPEKARADLDKKIVDYYTNTAHELKLVMECFMKEGFTREEAFEIVKLLVPDKD